jgi:co-chaperonin GroES (HSP10)
MNIKPIGKKLAVVKLKSETTTESGLILTKAVDTVDKAKVIAVGSEVADVKVGETVLINWNKASATTIDNIPIYMLTEEDVVGIFD